MKIENKHAKRFSEISTEVEDMNEYGFGTGIVSSKMKGVMKSDNGGGYIAVFSQREGEGIKVVKIKDDFWFPHMFPELYEEERIDALEKRFKWKRKNYSKMIPFA